MATIRRSAPAALILGLFAACGGDSENGSTEQSFGGTWAICRNDGGNDYREVLRLAGSTFTVETISHATTDLSCDGDGLGTGPGAAAAISFGPQRAFYLGAGVVQGTEVNITWPASDPYYQVLWRDADVAPDLLYLGDDSGGNDGSSPERRPGSLQAALPRALQTIPAVSELAGAWESCSPMGGEIVTVNPSAGTLRIQKYTGTCGVAANLVDDSISTFTLSPPQLATYRGATVTALALDVGMPPTSYTTIWVDHRFTPARFYRGEDGLHGMDGSSAALRPRVLWDAAYVKR